MKKVIFLGLTVFLALSLASCGFFASPDLDGEMPSVQYSADGRSVTLRIDGGGTDRKASRALTDVLAQAGHDYFEVVFKDGTNIARASWEIGAAASITSVPRNVKYDDGTSAGIADPEKAILFVGRKADRTLLAVGLLTAVDAVVGGDLEILPTSKTVTFTVAAFTSSVVDPTTFPVTVDPLSFYTDSKTTSGTPTSPGTDPATLKASDGYLFPISLLPKDETVAALYTIGSTGTIADYLPGIIVSGAAKYFSRVPTYLAGTIRKEFTYITKPPTVTFGNVTVGSAFDNEIEMTIVTEDDDGLYMLSFQIPVYAIDTAAPSGVPPAINWFIRPGFGPNLYLLDAGTGNAGGGVLLGIGELDPLEVLIIGP